MFPEISSTFSFLETSSKSLWKFVDSSSIRIGLFPPNPDLSFSPPVAVGLRRCPLAPLKGSPSSPLPAAPLAFVSRRRKSSSAPSRPPPVPPLLPPRRSSPERAESHARPADNAHPADSSGIRGFVCYLEGCSGVVLKVWGVKVVVAVCSAGSSSSGGLLRRRPSASPGCDARGR